MTRAFRSWPFLVVLALGCASSAPVECPEGLALAANGIECQRDTRTEPDAGPTMTDATPDGGADPDPCAELDCSDGNECTVESCEEGECANMPVEDGAGCAFDDGAGVCERGACVRDCEVEDCREVYPCTEQGLRDAVEDGGKVVIGCNGPTTVLLSEGELEIFKEVSIDGLGNLSVDAQGMSRAVMVHDAARVELVGMAITGGDATGQGDGSGGGVYGSAGAHLTLRDCRIYGNHAAGDGGGVRTGGTLLVENCVIAGNTAGERGGGIATFDADLSVSETMITDNRSQSDGGGVNVSRGTALLRECVVERNESSGSGAGIWASGSVTLDACQVRSNTANDVGGGARIYGDGELSTQNDTLFAGNTATEGGGAIATYQSGAVVMSRTTFTGNTAPGHWGGAILNDASPLECEDCAFERNSAEHGGAVFGRSSWLTFRRSTFADNEAVVRGGAFRIYRWPKDGGVAAAFQNCTISGNRAGASGGGIANHTGRVTLDHTTVSGNAAPDGTSAFYLESAKLYLTHSVVDGGCLGDANSLFGSLGYNAVLTPAVEQCVFTPDEGVSTDLALSAEEMGLGALAENGGPTKTHMPALGSVLIDAAPSESCISELDIDQRGEPRNGDGACDIGAVEVQPGE